MKDQLSSWTAAFAAPIRVAAPIRIAASARSARQAGIAGALGLSLLALSACNTMTDFGTLSPTAQQPVAATPPVISRPTLMELTGSNKVPRRKPIEAEIVLANADGPSPAPAETAPNPVPAYGFAPAALADPTASRIPTPLRKPENALGLSTASPHYVLGVFNDYWRDVTRVSNYKLRSRTEIRAAHQRLSKYDYSIVSQGWVVAHAVEVMEDEAFVEEARAKAASMGRAAFFAELKAKPYSTLSWRTAPAAVERAIQQTAAENTLLVTTAQRFRERAINMQRKKAQSDPDADHAQDHAQDLATDLALLLNPTIAPSRPMTLINSAGEQTLAMDISKVSPISRPTYGRIISLAAYLSVPGAGPNDLKDAMKLTKNETDRQCLKFAQLNLAQCIAASRNLSEEAFCTGRHGFKEVADCWTYLVQVGSPT